MKELYSLEELVNHVFFVDGLEDIGADDLGGVVPELPCGDRFPCTRRPYRDPCYS